MSPLTRRTTRIQPGMTLFSHTALTSSLSVLKENAIFLIDLNLQLQVSISGCNWHELYITSMRKMVAKCFFQFLNLRICDIHSFYAWYTSWYLVPKRLSFDRFSHRLYLWPYGYWGKPRILIRLNLEAPLMDQWESSFTPPSHIFVFLTVLAFDLSIHSQTNGKLRRSGTVFGHWYIFAVKALVLNDRLLRVICTGSALIHAFQPVIYQSFATFWLLC